MFADEELHRHAVQNIAQADALLFGRVIYEIMEAAFRPPARTGAMPDWMEPFARTIDAAKKYFVSGTFEGTARTQVARSASLTGICADRIAGIKPPISPMHNAQLIPSRVRSR